MKALRWHGRGDVRLDDVPPLSPPGPSEVQLRILWCGICGTDIEEIEHGPVLIPTAEPHPLTGAQAPLTLGHEFTGIVEAVGADVKELSVGERIACDVLVTCGRCRWCWRGETTRCPQMAALGLQADGGLAERCNAPARACLPLPSSVSDDDGALAETLAVAVRALRRGRLQPGEHVAVVGAGPVGLLAAQAAAAFGAAEVTVIESHAARRELARALGADRALAPEDAGAIRSDVVLECAGSSTAFATALAAAGTGGRIVLVGLDQSTVPIRPVELVTTERELIGSLSHVWHEDFRIALGLLASGRVRASPVISRRLPLSKAISEGFDALRQASGEQLKVLITPDQGGRSQ